MKCYYPYLESRKDDIKKIIKNEEERFIKTLNSGEAILSEMIKGKKELSGKDAFKLYDTYGFTIELTKEICQDEGVKVDLDGFNEALNKQKELARASRKNIESFNKQSKDLLDFNLKSDYTHDDKDIKATVIGLFKDGVKKDEIDDEGDIVFDKTNFYAEMGGQVADTGTIESKDFKAEVKNVISAPNKEHLHHIKVLYGSVKVGNKLTLKVDKDRHFAFQKNHSGTHLLQSALIEVLGNECRQKGSFVNEDYLRFDFAFSRKVNSVELAKVEKIVNEYIAKGIKEKTLILPIEEAKKVGAISLFDEKYGDEVRVVTFGDVSKEFCGGTHVNNTSDIGYFKIISESAISSGVRRIEACTGFKAFEYSKSKEDILKEAENLIEAKNDNEIGLKINALLNLNKEKDLKVSSLIEKLALLNSEKLIAKLNEKKYLIEYLPDFDKAGLLALIDIIKTKINSFVVVLIGKEDDKYPIICSVSEDLVKESVKAGNILKNITAVLGGNGGGRPNIAQGSIKEPSKISSINLNEIIK